MKNVGRVSPKRESKRADIEAVVAYEVTFNGRKEIFIATNTGGKTSQIRGRRVKAHLLGYRAKIGENEYFVWVPELQSEKRSSWKEEEWNEDEGLCNA